MKPISQVGMVLVLFLALTACAGPASGGSGSRAELYDSIEALANDSALVAVVVATDVVSERKEPQPMMGFTVEIAERLTPAGLPATQAASPTIVVWQLGNAQTPGPVPFIKSGESYLLFLTPTGLDDLKYDYFVTGSSAGFWVAEADGYVRPVDEGDRLPEHLTLDDLT